jgi:hypothetical protein
MFMLNFDWDGTITIIIWAASFNKILTLELNS